MTHRFTVQIKKKYIAWLCRHCKSFVSRMNGGREWFKWNDATSCRDGNGRGLFY